MKNQMVEKKVILCAVLAIAIGIATVIPMEYMMAAQAQENVQAAQTQANAQVQPAPWFNPSLTYVALTYDNNATTQYTTLGPLNISVAPQWVTFGFNFTLNNAAVNNLAKGCVEFYQLQIYSDAGPIANMTEFFGAVTGNGTSAPLLPFGDANFNITALGHSIGSNGGGGEILTGFNGTLPAGTNQDTVGYPVVITQTQSLLNLQNANVLYLNLLRTCYVTFNSNSTTVIKTNGELIQHIELHKNGNSFIYGSELNYGNSTALNPN